jgi:acyl-CoA reductase-like NAD-dependent aldehyde dehydrogenase
METVAARKIASSHLVCLTGRARIPRSSSSLRLFTSTSSSLSTTAPLQPWLVDSVYQFYQNGKLQSTSSNNCDSTASRYCYGVLLVKDPASQQVVGKVPEMTNDEFKTAVSVAKDAFDEWKNVPVQQCQRIMLKLQQSIRDNTDDLAYLITLENDKTLADARGDIFRGLEVMESACWMALAMMGETLSGLSRDIICTPYHEPLGGTASIAPFNFPGRP